MADSSTNNTNYIGTTFISDIENKTFSTIINDALNRVPDKFNKREGAIIYDSLAPAARIAEDLFNAIRFVIDQPFPDTSDREFLVRWAAVFGYSPYDPTPAIIKVKFTFDRGTVIPENFRLNYKEFFYRVLEVDEEGENTETTATYLCQCETPGVAGNHAVGTILPCEHLPGLRIAEIVGVAINGEDEEDTETFRERFLASFNADYFGGNRADYLRFTNALPGVGACKVERCPRGAGTVDVYILDTDYNKATPELISSVQEEIEPTADSFPALHYCGLGIAPIGHEVEVKTVTEKDIEVGLKLTFDSTHDWDGVVLQVQEKIEQYFTELKKTWQSTEAITIQAWAIVQAISDIEGIIDISLTQTTMNGQTDNITIGAFEIPKLSGVVKSVEVIPEEPDQPICPDCPCEGQCESCPRAAAIMLRK